MADALLYDPIRFRPAVLVKRGQEDTASLSRMVGRSSGYLGAYLRRGTPKALPKREREMLAGYLRVHPNDLLPLTLREGRVEAMARQRGAA